MQTNEEGLSTAYAILKTQNGEIKIQFYPKEAPNTVARITQLISEGFYNGIVFHRVVPNFVAQAGDPTGTGTSGSGKKLKAEFNSRSHTPGTVAMARSQDPDSADSQFYITLADTPHLNGQYTVFGTVTEGFENVTNISQGDEIQSFEFFN